jgi:hypothetical protein
VKKLISIGIALALLTMVVVPAAVAAATPQDPVSFAKIPFAIVASGFYLLDEILPDLMAEFAPDMAWIADLMVPIGDWAYGPLAWSVDMLAWGVQTVGAVVGALPMITDQLPEGLDIVAACDVIADQLRECFGGGCLNLS